MIESPPMVIWAFKPTVNKRDRPKTICLKYFGAVYNFFTLWLVFQLLLRFRVNAEFLKILQK
jgi:hypothetical protein